MGGEPCSGPSLFTRSLYYSAKKDIFVYLPTNGRLMTPDVIDRLGDAGLATVNLAIDSVKDKKSLPKALDPIRTILRVPGQAAASLRLHGDAQYQHLPQQHGRRPELTEIAHDNVCDRLPHQRDADDRAGALQASRGEQTYLTAED